MNRIAVLGRGMSLQYFRDYSHLFKKIYIVNSFSKEITEAGSGNFRNKEIIHVVSRKGNTALTKREYSRFKIKRIQSNAFRKDLIENKKYFKGKVSIMPEYMNERGYEPVGWDKIAKGEFTGKRKSPNLRAWPTTGLMAIDLALTENKPEEIYLFGFDFYEQPYFAIKRDTKRDPDKIMMMEHHMDSLVREFKNTTFYSASKYKIDESNWHNIGPNKKLWKTEKVVDIINRQQSLGKFNRMDIFARYLAIEHYYGKNDIGWPLYMKMQSIRMKDNPGGAQDKKNQFIELIKSVETEGYKNIKPIRINRKGKLLNGSHRLATCLYFGVEEVLTWVDNYSKKKVHFNIKWFRKKKFKGKIITQVEKKAIELSERCKGSWL